MGVTGSFTQGKDRQPGTSDTEELFLLGDVGALPFPQQSSSFTLRLRLISSSGDYSPPSFFFCATPQFFPSHIPIAIVPEPDLSTTGGADRSLFYLHGDGLFHSYHLELISTIVQFYKISLFAWLSKKSHTLYITESPFIFY